MMFIIRSYDNFHSGVLGAVIFCLVLPHVTFASETAPGQRIYKTGHVVIGGLFPVHVRGDFRSKYMSLAEAMIFAIEQINNNSSILPNVTLGYDITDTNLTNRHAMNSSLDYVNVHKFAFIDPSLNGTCAILPKEQLAPVVAVVGTGTSRSSILVSNLLEVEDIPLISYAATSDELSSSAYPSFFRTVPPDRFQSKVMSDIAKHFHWTYVAAVAADDAYGRSGIDFFRKQSKLQGICIAYNNIFPINDERDAKIKTIIEELKQMENVGVIVLYCDSTSALSVLREAKSQKLEGRIWIASEAWGNNDAVIHKKELQPVLKGMLGVVFTDMTVPSYKRYLLSRTSLYRSNPWWRVFWEDQYGCTFNVTLSTSSNKALCSDNLKVTEDIFDKKLYDSKTTYVINAVYAIAHALDAIFKCKFPSTGHCPQTKPFVETKDVLEYLKKVNFSTETSRVFFDENGDSLATYSIINYRVDKDTGGRVETVGTWEAQRLNLNSSAIVWNNGMTGKIPRSVCSETCKPGFRQTEEMNCCWQCIKCSQDTVSSKHGARNCTPCPADYISNEKRTKCHAIPVERILWGDSIGIMITFFACLGVVATALVGAVFIWQNNTPIVKASNRELSYLFLFSIGMTYLWALINLAEPSDFICPVTEAWFYVFYTIAVVVLGVKTKRIVHLFEHRVPRSELSKGFIEKRKHILIIIGILGSDVLILVIWFLLDPPHPEIDKSVRTSYYLGCKVTSNVAGSFCHYLLIAILVTMSFVCCYFAFKSRKLPHNFNEGKFIAFALYVLVISWVTFYPVSLTIRGKFTVVVSGSSSIISASGLLVCIFVPKMYIILLHPEKNTVAYMKSQISNHTFRQSTADRNSRHKSCPPDSVPSVHGSATTSTPADTPRYRESPKLSHPGDLESSNKVISYL
ncbi:extracellular calcium-sensing receptor-like [Acropora palmata]|uniref:extracellular calcium-sensing receptor-like n=1 Tax=Acropora palmata TaxID=6131 RepID=UPI003DA18FF7